MAMARSITMVRLLLASYLFVLTCKLCRIGSEFVKVSISFIVFQFQRPDLSKDDVIEMMWNASCTINFTSAFYLLYPSDSVCRNSCMINVQLLHNVIQDYSHLLNCDV